MIILYILYLIGQHTLFGSDLVLKMKTLDEVDCVVQRGPAYWLGTLDARAEVPPPRE